LRHEGFVGFAQALQHRYRRSRRPYQRIGARRRLEPAPRSDEKRITEFLAQPR
jgi:hypothetical protein